MPRGIATRAAVGMGAPEEECERINAATSPTVAAVFNTLKTKELPSRADD
jgi:hypothetical protein